MKAIVININESIAIYSYGVFIAIGFFLFLFLLQRDTRYYKLQIDTYLTPIIGLSTLTALLGARLLYVFSEENYPYSLDTIYEFWNGGLSVLGALSGVVITIFIFFYVYRLPLLPFLDIVSTYAPLFQSIGRIGCFCAGCCHGFEYQTWYSIYYTDIHSSAPLYVYLFPTQLISSFILCAIFIMLYLISKKYKQPGTIFFLYLICASIERFSIDFLRGDRVMFSSYVSYNQLYALLLIIIASAALLYLYHKKYHCNRVGLQ